MGKILAISIAVPVIAAAAGAGFLTYQNIQAYDQQLQQVLSEQNKELHGQGVKINYQLVSSGWLGAVREELFTVSDLQMGADMIALRQQVTFEPLRASATFGIDPDIGLAAMMMKAVPQLTAEQKGEWQVDGRGQMLVSHYQNGAVNIPLPGGQIRVSPLVIDGTMELSGKRESRATISLKQVSVTDSAQGSVMLNDFSIKARSHAQAGKPFIDKIEYQIGDLDVSAPMGKTRLSGFNLTAGSLLDKGIYSMLVSLSVKDVKTSMMNKDLSVDPSSLRLFIDGIHWDKVEKTADMLNQTTDEGLTPEAMIGSVMELAASGGSVTLEDLNYSFVMNDRSADALSASGDIRANGFARLSAGDAETLMEDWHQRLNAGLTLNLSRSLMQSPAAEYMMAFIASGVLREEGDRLVSELKFSKGEITANNLPLNGLALND